MNDNLEKFTEVLKKESFVAGFNSAENIVQLRKVFLENGVDISEEELVKILEVAIKQQESQELTETEMETVSGGVLSAAFILGAGAALSVFAGIGAYNLHKFINTWNGTCN